MWSVFFKERKKTFGVKMKIVYFSLKLIENASNLKYRSLPAIVLVLLLSPCSYSWQIEGLSFPPQE